MTQKTEHLIKQKRQQYIEKFQDSLAKSPKFFRFYQTHILRNRISPSANTYDNVITTTSQKKALQRILCCCFSSDILFLKHRPKHDIKNMEIISDIQISELEVKNFLINVYTTNACGPTSQARVFYHAYCGKKPWLARLLVAQTEYYHAYSKNAMKKFSQASDLQIVQHVVLWQLAAFVWDANMRMLCSSTRKNSCEPVHMQLPSHFSSANSL